MTEDQIRKIIREELAARPPQIVVVPAHPQPMPRYLHDPYPYPTYWPATCGGLAYSGSSARPEGWGGNG